MPLKIGVQKYLCFIEKDWNPVPGIRSPWSGIPYPHRAFVMAVQVKSRFFSCLYDHSQAVIKVLSSWFLGESSWSFIPQILFNL